MKTKTRFEFQLEDRDYLASCIHLDGDVAMLIDQPGLETSISICMRPTRDVLNWLETILLRLRRSATYEMAEKREEAGVAR